MGEPRYNPRRTRNLYDPSAATPYKLSRSKIELFIKCPRCFYLDRRLGVSQPPGYPFSLNLAVDELLKREFDIHRKAKTPHILMTKFGVDAVPFDHQDLDKWRDALHAGVMFHHEPTNLLITGAVDDVWLNRSNELIVVDYKATAKKGPVTIDAEWQHGYKRQMEIYQWLLRMNGFNVSRTGYFVYCNGDATKDMFNFKLEFDISLLPYTGGDDWVESAVRRAHASLNSQTLPAAANDCEFCLYRKAAQECERALVTFQNS